MKTWCYTLQWPDGVLECGLVYGSDATAAFNDAKAEAAESVRHVVTNSGIAPVSATLISFIKVDD